MTDLSNCPICGGLREDGVCDEFHPATAEERMDAKFKAWIYSEMRRAKTREQD